MPPRLSNLFMRFPPLGPALRQLRLRRPASNFQNRRRHAPKQAFKQAPFGRPSSTRDRWRTQPGFRICVVGAGVAVFVFVVWNLEVVPVSGRVQFNCVPESVELERGAAWYEQIMRHYEGQILPQTHPYSVMVNRVMERLLEGSDEVGWEAVVIDDETINAFVLPGKKVFIYSGLIPICENDDGLASILGHEIAHNVAHHLGETLSARWAVSAIAYAIATYFDLPRGLIDQVLDIGYSKPGSRQQELEADYIGFWAVLMAQACYRLEDAVQVRARMMKAANDQGERTPQFLSTHPSDENRVQKLIDWFPEAREIQTTNQCAGVMEHADDFHQAFNMQTKPQTDDDEFW